MNGMKLFGCAALLVAFAAAPALAADPAPAAPAATTPATAVTPAGPENEFGLLLGGELNDKELHGEDAKLGPVLGLRFAHFFGATQKISWFIDATASRHDTLLSSDKYDTYTARTGPEFYFTPAPKNGRFFIAPSVGYEKFSFSGDQSFSSALAGLGIGQRFRVGGTNAFSWQLRADQALSGGGGEADIKPLDYQLLLGYAWGICSSKDDDGDGVKNCKDYCAGTPKGATVDARGCPMDGDADGVYDGLDKCPGTPKGATVDANGCPMDSDGDGVYDGLDKCPGTPKGATVDANGCPKDSDGDGVLDGLDKCPDTPRGYPVDANGCPVDSDRDGVLDGRDKCPNTPQGTKVDENGCPLPEPPKAAAVYEKQKAVVLEGVYFDTDKSTLKPESIAVLDRVAASLVEVPDWTFEIGGHTDSTGPVAHNRKLSEARAETVKAYLVSKGVAAARLSTKGYGPDKPIGDNKTAEGKAKNRRVELTRTN